MTKVLNLYAGIGGNRKLWKDVEVIAVEWNETIAEYYQSQFPEDEVIIGDAHEYLETHLNDGWDFIWSSYPCPSHSRTNLFRLSDDHGSGQYKNSVRYPDMGLYEEIIFLRYFCPIGTDWVVENVQPYYESLIEPQRLGRHCFWSNYRIPYTEFESLGLKYSDTQAFADTYGFDLSGWSFSVEKRKVLRNCVDPKLGMHVFESRHTQATLTEAAL